MSEFTVLLAGGGTGGHVFPLVAIAHALKKLSPGVRPVVVGTSRGMETRFVPEQGLELELLDVLPMRGSGALGLARGAARAAALLPESVKLIRKYDAHGVFSVGGYAAGPVSLAARLLGLPVALLEPNSAVGLANLLIAPFVQRAYTAFERAERVFAPGVVRPLGVPLRPGFDAVPYAGAERVRVLVLGGSQGAKSLNETLPEALSRFDGKVQITHQCGRAHVEAVGALYERTKCSSVTVTPFIDDMPRAIADADLVVSRSGAGAVSEIVAIGRPSLLIPYPHASGDHQRLNAEAIAQRGAAICIENHEATVARIEAELAELLGDRQRLARMAESAQKLGRPHASEEIASDFLSLVGSANFNSIGAKAESAPPWGKAQAPQAAFGGMG